MGSARTMLSAEQFLELPPQEGKRFELNEGEVVERPRPAFRCGKIASALYFRIDRFLREHLLGEVFPLRCGFKLSPATVRGPDVSFLTTDRARLLDPDSNHFDGAPDLAVEIVSPSDTARDLQQKVGQYLRAGAHAVWVIYPDTQEVHAFGAGGALRRLGTEDRLEAPDLLPGFSLPVGELFSD